MFYKCKLTFYKIYFFLVFLKFYEYRCCLTPDPHPLLRDGYSLLLWYTSFSSFNIQSHKCAKNCQLLGQMAHFLKSKPAHMSEVKSQKTDLKLEDDWTFEVWVALILRHFPTCEPIHIYEFALSRDDGGFIAVSTTVI